MYSPQTQGTVDTIVSAANQVGVRPDLLLDIAAQESALGNLGPNNPDLRTSGFHPTARSASGVFQFTAPTWAEGVRRYAKELGIEPISAEPYTDEWLRQIDQYRLDPRLNSLMAAMFIRDGMLSRWNASKNVWGNVYSDEELRPYLN